MKNEEPLRPHGKFFIPHSSLINNACFGDTDVFRRAVCLVGFGCLNSCHGIHSFHYFTEYGIVAIQMGLLRLLLCKS